MRLQKRRNAVLERVMERVWRASMCTLDKGPTQFHKGYSIKTILLVSI